MSDEPTFAEQIVSKLGTPKEPFGLDDFLFLFVLLLGIGAYLALEQGVAHGLRRLFRSHKPHAEREEKPPPTE